MTLNIAESVVIDIPSDILKQNPRLKNRSRRLSIKYAHREMVSEEDLKTVGGRLWDALGMAEYIDAARERAGARILPVILRAESPETLALPWECLHHPELGFLGKHDGFTLSRQVPGKLGRIDDPPTGPLKVLLFTSLPDDLDAEKERLDTEEEQENVIEALDPWVREGRAELICPDDGGFSTFRDLLKQEEFHLVFLSGHGQFQDNSLHGKPSRSFFIFEGEDGRSDARPADEIAAVFMGSHVRCVALSACRTGNFETSDDHMEPELNAGLALRIYQAGIPHVIGMRESIFDSAGIQFSRAFCNAVGRGERVDVAIQLARQAITRPFDATDAIRRDRADAIHAELGFGQWCLPALYTRNPACDLVNREFPPKEMPFELLMNDAFEDIQVPRRFIGRRMELRALGRSLGAGRTRRLLITGVGGQGKTRLAGRLAKGLEKRGYRIHGFSARPPADWDRFVSELKWSLDDGLLEQVERNWGRCKSEEEKALLLLKALVHQTKGKTVLFLDNLETLQNPDNGEALHPGLAACLKAGTLLGKNSPITLVTSRWEIPAFEEGVSLHHPLRRPSYGDFLRFGQEFPRPGAGIGRKSSSSRCSIQGVE